MSPHLLCIGGEDHYLRIPFMLGLRDRGFRISAAGAGEFAPFAQAGLDHFSFGFDRFMNPAENWAAIGRLAGLFAEVRPDIVQSFDTKPNLLAPLAARRAPPLPIVRTVNGRGWVYSSRAPLALAARPVYCALQRLAARTTTATVFQNRDDQAFFKARRIVDGSASRLISGSGLDVEGFAAAQAAGPPPVRLREALGLGASEVVMTVTRLTRQKGVPTLLEAAALVHAVRPGVRFLLVGPRESEGPFAVSQAALDRHAPYVMAIGARRDVPALLRIADAFAFPSEYCEGLPRALLEAGLAGLPIVTTAMPGCGDVVRDGWNGFVVPPRAPRALAARILDLLGDRAAAAAMGRRSVDFVKRQFSLESVVAAYAALYAETLDREHRSARTGAAMDLRRQDHAAGI